MLWPHCVIYYLKKKFRKVEAHLNFEVLRLCRRFIKSCYDAVPSIFLFIGFSNSWEKSNKLFITILRFYVLFHALFRFQKIETLKKTTASHIPSDIKMKGFRPCWKIRLDQPPFSIQEVRMVFHLLLSIPSTTETLWYRIAFFGWKKADKLIIIFT